MSKTIYSYQEIGTLIDQGRQVIFTCHPVVRVTAVQKKPNSDLITVTLVVSIGETCVGIMENEYASIYALLEAFNIGDLDEIWEVVA
jgi:hypothetical protein